MSEKEFGVKFTKTDNGFKLEFQGDDETIQAHREVAEAWKEFVSKARQAGEKHWKHLHHECCCCCDEDEKAGEVQDIKAKE